MTRKSRHAVVGVLGPLLFVVPLAAGLGDYLLLLRAGAHQVVAVLAGVVQCVGGYVVVPGIVLSHAMDGRSKMHDPPASAVLYFLGRAAGLVAKLVLAPLILVAALPAIALARTRR